MEYFVSVESHPYYCWQLELLIESFKENKLSNALVVVMSELDAPQNIGKNLIEHKRLHGYQNIGDARGYKPLSPIYNLFWTLQSKQLEQPFVYMQPDMVLRSEPNIQFSNYPEFIFSPDPFFTFEKAEAEIGPFCKWLNSDYSLNWLPLGSIFVANKIPIELFNLVAMRVELLAIKQLIDNKPISNLTIKTAFSTVLSDYSENISCHGDYSLVSDIMDGTNSSFISYENGLLPDFHKSMFLYSTSSHIAFGDPIKILSNTSTTPNSHYVSILAGKNLQSRNKEIE